MERPPTWPDYFNARSAGIPTYLEGALRALRFLRRRSEPSAPRPVANRGTARKQCRIHEILWRRYARGSLRSNYTNDDDVPTILRPHSLPHPLPSPTTGYSSADT